MKRDTFIKILSLSLGLTIGIVLIAKIFYELSYDTSYPDNERIYIITTGFVRGEDHYDFNQISGGVAPGFKDEVPGVESATRLTWLYSNPNFKDSEGNIISGNSFAADSYFFDVFSNEILVGDPHEILENPEQVMVSETFAEKLGGVTEAMGKRIANVDNPDDFKIINGVYKDFKKNGSINPDVLWSLNTINDWSRNNWLGNDRYVGYVKLKEGVNAEGLNDAIHKMQKNHQDLDELEQAGVKIWYKLELLSQTHLRKAKVKSAVIILSVMVFLIITISLMNYILIVISGLVKRSREIGVRKCYGANKTAIYKLLFKESSWQIITALFLSALLIFLGRGLIEDYTSYKFEELMVSQSIIAICVFVAFVFIISVLVPAGLYMRIPVAKAINGYHENSRKWKLGLLSVQILINVFMVCFVIIVTFQYRKANNFNPGYSTSNIVYVEFFSKEMSDYERILNSLEDLPFIEETGICLSLPFIGVNGNDTWPPDAKPDERFNIADIYPSTSGIFDIFQPNFIEGGKPQRKGEVTVSKSYVEKMNNFVDWKDGAVGKQIFLTGHNESSFTVSGVYDDILIGNLLNSDNRPSVWPYGELIKDEYFYQYIVMKVEDINPSILAKIKETLEKTIEAREFDVMVYSDGIKASYEESRKIRDVLAIGGFSSLLIALIGLIGFLNNESQRRRKELAIRKINGASSKDLFNLFYLSIIKLSLASAVVACCGAFIMGRQWLQQFSEKITLSPLIFVCGTLIILIIVTVVVMVNSYKVVTANPTQSLYNE